MNKLKAIMLASAVVLTFALTAGCSMDRWVEVRSGDYIPVDNESIYDSPATGMVDSMQIDRQNNTMKLVLTDGSIISSALSARPKEDWPSGCPANLGSTRMEVLDLDVNEIAIGDIVIDSPILVRNCPDDPERVILREDGQIGGAGTACAHDDDCIHFKPGEPG